MRTPATLLLEGQGIAFTLHTYEYEERGGARHAAACLGVDEHVVVKTLVLRTDDGTRLLALVPGDRQVALERLAREVGARKVSSCSPEEAEKVTGYTVGGISPFATRTGLAVFAEASIFDLPLVYINGGRRGLLLGLDPRAIRSTLAPREVAIAARGPGATGASGGPKVRLVLQDAELLEVLASPRGFLERYGADVSAHLDVVRDVVKQTLEFQSRVLARHPWTGYLTVSVASNTVVGCGGFKGNPTSDGSVEIAYFTFPAYERQGFGTATARELVAVARAAGGLRSAVAHTLPRPSASTRILQRIGFEHVGEALDPEDGRVWHWRLPLA